MAVKKWLKENYLDRNEAWKIDLNSKIMNVGMAITAVGWMILIVVYIKRVLEAG